MSYQPLEVEFRLSTPVCLTYPWIHFDGILAHLLRRRADPDKYRCLPSKALAKERGLTLPLKTMRFGSKREEYVYHASVSVFDFTDPSATTVYKRFCMQYLDVARVRRSRIDLSRGRFRAFAMKLLYLPARTVRFYCSGDEAEVKELVRGLPALGKKTSIGFGLVKSVSVKPVDEDWSITRDGVAMRPIPHELAEYAEDYVMMAYTSPYWAPENVRLCVPPFTRVRLKSTGRPGRHS